MNDVKLTRFAIIITLLFIFLNKSFGKIKSDWKILKSTNFFFKSPMPSFDSPEFLASSSIKYESKTHKDFTTRESRINFMRKVYSTFGTQQLTLVWFTALIALNNELAKFLYQNLFVFVVGSFLGSSLIATTLVLNPQLRYEQPTNIILLGLFSIFQSAMVGSFSTLMNPKMVCFGTMHNLAAFLLITLYSYQPFPNLDANFKGFVCLCLSASLFVSVLLFNFANISMVDNLISATFTVVFNVGILYEAQCIATDANSRCQYSPKEFVLASINPYPTIVNLLAPILNNFQGKENTVEHSN
jgi:FtsH-binding integral membrane protein